jgi:lipopolysaccharide/colanic/teichoic acid biosynthesis glycosyltransferase
VEQGAIVSQCVVGSGARVIQHTHLSGRVVPAEATNVDARQAPDASNRPPWPSAVRLPGHNGNGSRLEQDGSRERRLYPLAKRTFDLAVALAGVIVLSPLLLLTAVLVKLSSPGPALYGDEREGRGGRVFRCWKFRTMIEGAHARQRDLHRHKTVDGPQFKMPNDPRVTLLGRLLRFTNIDELPQLLNVLRGDMSLIGPRPSPFRENQICVPWREARLSVRPGITGLWQVCRHERRAGDFHQWIYFDTLYVRHRAFWLDLRILMATFLTAGGRWGVPLRWMIPAHELRRWDAAALPHIDPTVAPRTALSDPDPARLRT